MNGDLLAVFEYMEREKGIDREELIKAVEASLLSAARKSVDPIAKRKHLEIEIDRETGNIRAFTKLTVVSDEVQVGPDEISLTEAQKTFGRCKVGDVIRVEITPRDFGRVAAQTAKQIIIQKIKEAERDHIYEEYKGRIGDIVLGTVRRKERDTLIVDLGRAEAVLPPREQCVGERYNIGNRLRAYILDVRQTSRGAEIILSRASVGFIRRLFELEVPEIVDGSVEIKAIAREAGVRTKILVASNDPKIDPVGACVGIRGSRVKNIVRELGEEKLDIIKWDPDIRAVVSEALRPAVLEEIIVKEEEKRIEVRVQPDQLSLAIGKRGQNVRLASKLIGWEIDVRKSTGEGLPKEEETELSEGKGKDDAVAEKGDMPESKRDEE